MASFLLPTSIQKRLLRYALSKIEILDTDALDLKNLDIAWGTKSVLEFKDTPLRLKVLTNLLQLPPDFELLKSQVSLLRLTIPVDIYSSPIVVEIEGVQAKLRFLGDSERKRNRGGTHRRETSRTQKGKHKSGSSSDAEEEDLSSAIPTARDLAASFLENESAKEKEELEAAIQSKSQAIPYAESEDDDDEETGTGTSIGLPVFMANFLKAVVDRLEVRVRNVVFNIDFQVPNDNGITDPVTIQLTIEEVDIEGITYQKKDGPTSTSPPNRKFTRKDGKRLINLQRIRCFLMSEATVFTGLAKSSSLSSPSTTQSECAKSRSSSRYTSKSNKSSRHNSEYHSDSVDAPDPARFHSPQDETPMASSIVASDGGRFDDAPEEDQEDAIDTSYSGALHSSAYSSQASKSQNFDRHFNGDHEGSDDENALAFGSQDLGADESPATPRALSRASFVRSRHEAHLEDGRYTPRRSNPLQSELFLTSHTTQFPDDHVHLYDSPQPTPMNSSQQRIQEVVSRESVVPEGEDQDDDNSSSSSSPEDLAQSMMFSHEEASSIYMSAMSETSMLPRMPGGWDEESNGSAPALSPPRNPRSNQQPQMASAGNSPIHTQTISDGMQSEVDIASASVRSVLEAQDSTPTPRGSPSPTIEQASRLPSLPKSLSRISGVSDTLSDEYSRVAKCIFRLDEVAIYLPPITPAEMSIGQEDGIKPPTSAPSATGDSPHSSSVKIPGAFSIHGNESKFSTAQKDEEKPQLDQTRQPESIEIFLGSLGVCFDVSVGRLIARIYILLSKCCESAAPSPSVVAKTEPPSSEGLRVKFRGEKLSLKFLDRLVGNFVGSPTYVEQAPWDTTLSPDVLLQTSLEGLDLDVDLAGSITKASITLEKFIFGYASENIISFDFGLRLYDSVRDFANSGHHDITVDIVKTAETMRVSMNTLPVCVAIDLQRLDETFSWFGGLSGVMNMGSSVASNTTMIATNPNKVIPKPRGVHFDTSFKPDNKSATTQNKVDARIGGFVLQLVGQECSVSFETSAVKIISRDEGIGMAIDTIRLLGPHIHNSKSEPAINAEFKGTRVEFLTTPKDTDLDRLLSLITPSNAKYGQDDDILVDTLLRQRKKGAVLRLTIERVKTHVNQLDDLKYLPELGRELSRLSTVAKYLPEDDRPGLLSLILIRNVEADVDVNAKFGQMQLNVQNIEVAQITLPSLMALSMKTISLGRNGSEELIGAAPGADAREPEVSSPAIMARIIGDEMVPMIKVKLCNLRLEYSIPALMAILGLSAGANGEEVSAELAASIATLTGGLRPVIPDSDTSPKIALIDELQAPPSSPLKIEVVVRDCVVGLNPLGLSSKILVVMTEARFSTALPKNQDVEAVAKLNKASLLVIDDVANISPSGVTKNKRRSYDGGSSQVSVLCDRGFVSVGYMSSAQAILKITCDLNGENRCIEVELKDDLLVLESCADSTQTLMATLGALSPPTPPSTAMKYRTKVVPMEDLLASLTGDAFATANNDTYDFDEDFNQALDPDSDESLPVDYEDDIGLDFGSHYSQRSPVGDPYIDHNPSVKLSPELSSRDTHDGVLLESFDNREQILTSGEPLTFDENYFQTRSLFEDNALNWSSTRNEYVRPVKPKGFMVNNSPLRLHVRDVHIIWNLFDGYDWQSTRDKITKKVQEVETRAIEKKARQDRPSSFDQDIEDEETVISDMLFNSIYIGIPSNKDPRELAMAINQEINNGISETESVATTVQTFVSQRQGSSPRAKGKRLRLKRSKDHKITFELTGVNADVVVFPQGSGETLNSIDIKVRDLEVFDHIPTSTWKKFATYMHDAGERETGTSMIHIELLNVKPDPDLTASEMVVRVTILPLRLYVDQDALDFITRFFEFKDTDATKGDSQSDVPFLQRVEVNDVRIRLNYKPKRVNYAGIRSGHTGEFKNIVNLDEANIVLKHAIVFGTSGFDKLGVTLNNIWTDDVKRNQLRDILGAIGPVKSLVNVGSGVRDLIVIPMREYKKDGRIVRSIRKGVFAFAKTTGMEVIKAGAKIAIGTQTVLQGAEEFLNKKPTAQYVMSDEEDEDEEGIKRISPYAAQPIGVMQGMRGGMRSLKRDLFMARDAIIAVPGEVMESGGAGGAAKAVFRRAPTVIIRPLMGVTGAIGQGLMGVNNSLDPDNKRRTEDQYKSG